MHIIPHALGIIDDGNLDQVEALEQRCKVLAFSDRPAAKDACNQIMNYMMEVSGGVLNFDVRYFQYDWAKI